MRSIHSLRSCTRSGGSTLTATPAGSNTATVVSSLEPHFPPIQLAKLWGLSAELVRDLFLDEAGVLKIDRPERMNKRGYCSLRIPHSVADRVHRRLEAR